MVKGRDGVTLIELLVVMSIVMFVLTAASQLLASLIMQFKQQSKIAETGIESMVGLEILRRDIKGAGYGLPHALPVINYAEASDDSSEFNDAPNGVPRPIIGANPGFSTLNDSDYMVIKSLMVSYDRSAGKWDLLDSNGNKMGWLPSYDQTVNMDQYARVIVLDNEMSLVVSGGAWQTMYGATYGFTPDDEYERNIVYGVNWGEATLLSCPFNRADYYVSSSGVPKKCAPGTGVLVKRVMIHDGNKTSIGKEMPLLDCVADMQVIFRVDSDNDGDIDASADQLGSYSAEDMRKRVGEVRVFILTHEGQIDPNYEYPNQVLHVGDPGLGRNFNLQTDLGGLITWKNYRWRIYKMGERPGLFKG